MGWNERDRQMLADALRTAGMAFDKIEMLETQVKKLRDELTAKGGKESGADTMPKESERRTQMTADAYDEWLDYLSSLA